MSKYNIFNILSVKSDIDIGIGIRDALIYYEVYFKSKINLLVYCLFCVSHLRI